MSTNGDMPIDPMVAEQAPAAPEPAAPMPAEPQTPGGEPVPTMREEDPEGVAAMADQSYLARRDGAPEGDADPLASSSAAAREERQRLMPEYLEHYFIEDLPPIDPNDPWNQGIYMRYRINQWRFVNGMEPVE